MSPPFMTSLQNYLLPLPALSPPPGFGWEDRSASESSTTTAFRTGIERRDVFLGAARCIICGVATESVLQHCHIIPFIERSTWPELQERHYVPPQTKSVQHEPRNGMLLCPTHHLLFDQYKFYIRFLPDVKRFVFVNYANSDDSLLSDFHGRAIALDTTSRDSPFPALFLIHEMRVRGFHPFCPTDPYMPAEVNWQQWILYDNIITSDSLFMRNKPLASTPQHTVGPTINAGPTTSGAVSNRNTLPPPQDVWDQIIKATRESPSWKTCIIKGTSWDGTAEENIRKYASLKD